MGKKKQTQKVLAALMMVILLIGMIPGVASAYTSDDGSTWLGWLNFATSADSTLIAGEARNIHVQLWDNKSDPFTGSVGSATITDSEGIQTLFPISGTAGDYTISNVTLETAGDYQLVIRQGALGTALAAGTITVLNAKTIITDSLVTNATKTIRVKVTDSAGNPLVRKSGTVDGTTVGATNVSYTTLSDGTFTFTMTPTSLGTVNIIYAGHVVGSIPVISAYTQNARIGGTTKDNVSLSVDIAKSGWIQGARNVILTRDDQFSDALAAAPLSKKLDAPILMSGSSTLDERTLAEIRRLSAQNVYIVGGTAAISQVIQDSLTSNGLTITRIAGQQGYDTAALISSNVGIDPTHTVYLANGNAIPDAIAISAFAAEQGNPILLTDRDSLPPSTIQALADLKVSNVVLLGGTGVIGTSVENELRAKYSVQRWGGYDRYDTQSIIFQNLFNTQIPQSPLYFTSGLVRQDDVSSGKPYADALLTAALAAKTGGFVAMLPPSDLSSFSLSSPPYKFLFMNKDYISRSTVVGNFNAVSGLLEENLQHLLTH
ncbi:cell wall-binding repeat-containing protein [Desulfosporosinus metallidurans]|uniref:Putative cell wall-binding domain n=1 Tax=Desulfosporosinus metallidurans TaxID=1888891 RepID=A0A1Q8R0U0_9FIRM|nr:cell wall-binding repeat-containing protein [Desulfosporosinus metallidurans]OLN33010.1 putative cell wall-binding domain [Desulfosporosinus metallidurans]